MYAKAREYIDRILNGIDQQVVLWQNRQQIIREQNSTLSFDFLLPKTQRITELTVEAVQGSQDHENRTLFAVLLLIL